MRSDADSRAVLRSEDRDQTVDRNTGSRKVGIGPFLRVHRLRDLAPRERVMALALALALLVAPVSAAVRQFNTWTPAGDDALIEVRAHDAFTTQTPLIGQPSSSGLYGQRDRNAAHPGPIEFYLLAPAERVLGGGVGVLSTIAAISGLSVVVVAWAVYRQLGRWAGLAASAALAAVMWTSGAAAIVDVRSSAVGRFPLLCTVVLLWCLLCGDVRLLAVACVWLSFTLQQHLSILPATLVVTAVAVVGLGVRLVRQGSLRDRTGRRVVARNAGLAALVGLVLWAPVLYEQFSRSPGNLERIARYAGDKTRTDVGYRSALRQVAHALGLPPLLGRTNVSGLDLLARPSVLTWATALLAVALLAAAAAVWRRRDPRVTALVVVAGAVALGGVLNGANVPNSLEQIRIAFYHWAFTLAFLELLILLVVVAPVVAPVIERRYHRWAAARPAARPLLLRAIAGPVVLLLVMAPAIANLFVSRTDNHLLLLIPKQAVDRIEDQVRRRAGTIPQPTLLLSNDRLSFSGIYESIAVRLVVDGMDVKFPRDTAGYVADGRLVDYRRVRSGLVVGFGVGAPATNVPGVPVAEANPVPGFDRQAFAALLRQASAGSKAVIGSRLEQRLQQERDRQLARPGLSLLERETFAQQMTLTAAALRTVTEQPAKVLNRLTTLRLLADTPMVEPKLDHRLLERVIRTYPTQQGAALSATHVSVFLLNREQLLQYAPQP